MCRGGSCDPVSPLSLEPSASGTLYFRDATLIVVLGSPAETLFDECKFCFDELTRCCSK